VGTSFALKFISGKYQGGEFPVAEDHDLIVGRAAEFDMVLVEDMVSRKHAKISTQDGHLCIEDLGSTNGTFVNGERIDAETSLQEGDRILIGTSILRVVSTTPNSAANPQSASKEQKKEPIRAASGDDISGLLDEVRIPDLLALLNSAKKTGVLEANAADQCGKIFVRDGNIFYATINDNEEMGPHKVLSRLVGWESGHYQFGPMDDDLNFVFEIEDLRRGKNNNSRMTIICSNQQVVVETVRQWNGFHIFIIIIIFLIL